MEVWSTATITRKPHNGDHSTHMEFSTNRAYSSTAAPPYTASAVNWGNKSDNATSIAVLATGTTVRSSHNDNYLPQMDFLTNKS